MQHYSGIELLASGTAPTDTDEDGMPDSWEDDNNLDKNSYDANDNDLDTNYDNIEVYINSLIPNPCDTTGSSTTTFSLTTNTSGSGSISLDPAGGTYDSSTVVTLTATPDSGYQFDSWSGDLTGSSNPDSITMNANKSVTATFSASGLTAFIQDSGSDRIVSMEALPNDGDNINSNIETGSPRMDFRIKFVKTGTHYIWIRAYSDGGGDNSIQRGLNGSVVSTADSVDYPHSQSAYVWAKRTISGDGDARINISSTGVDTLNIWMREDGTMLDKIVLTTNSSYTPSGSGPSESSRALSKALVPEEELAKEIEVTLPTEYSLRHYPNPFNPSTTIVYDLPTREHVELTVFDIMGR